MSLPESCTSCDFCRVGKQSAADSQEHAAGWRLPEISWFDHVKSTGYVLNIKSYVSLNDLYFVAGVKITLSLSIQILSV